MRRIGEPLHISNQATLVIHLREDEQRRSLIKKLRRIWLMYKKGLFEHNLQARYEEVGYALHSLGQPDNYTFQLYSDTLWRSKVALFETRIYNWTECPLRQSLMNPVLEIQLDRPIPRVPNFDNNPVLPI